MQNRWHRVGCALLLGLCATPSQAQGEATLDFTAGVRNLSPIAALFALEPPVLREQDGLVVSLSTASHAVGESEGNNVLLIDGETNVLDLVATFSLGADWRVAVTVPYVWHATGSLDPLIDDWHRFFGLPDGIRDEIPRDDLRFEYLRDGLPVVDLTRNSRDLGDVRLAASWAPEALARHGLSLALGVKLPTGDAETLTGSGGTDVSAVLHWRRQTPTSRWLLEGSAGVAALGDADLALGDQTDTAWLGHVAVGYTVSPKLVLGTRLQLHTGPVADGPDPLSDTSVMLTTGGSITLNDDWRLDITFDEDINVDSAPDIVFRFALSRRFD
ncbi:MAG: DUF3187 family protein [Pseudomonadota bacterium]